MPTKITWTHLPGFIGETWNPVTGCSKVSPGCAHCFAESLSHRFGWTTKPWTAVNAAENVVCHEDRLMMPYRWKKPRAVFVCSMSDLFHPLVPEEFIVRVFDSAIACYTHLFLLLTKRPERMRDTMTARCAGRNVNDPPRNIWLGVTAENQEAADKRLPVLAETPAVKRFVSCEPLLEAVHLDLRGIDWVIVGGESGPNHRPMQPEWARGLRDQCKQAGVAFYFKQQSALRPGQGVDALGGTYHEYPEVEGAACRL